MAFGLTAIAQTTQVDPTQLKRPIKIGTTLPATCTAGDLFFNTNGPPGLNLYGCVTPNTWSLQGGAPTVSTDGVTVGSNSTLNFVTGTGLINTTADTGAQINVQIGLDSAVIQTQSGEQSATALLCASTSGSSSNYRCSLNPTASAYTVGMVLHWKPDVNGAGSATTLNVDTLGAVSVKLADGVSNPGQGDLLAGRLYNVWYDGTFFRLMPTTAASMGALPDPGSSGIAYRSGPGAATLATADNLSGPFSCQDSGTGSAYTCNLSPSISGYVSGTTYWFQAKTTNSGPATISFNALPPKAIKKLFNQALAPNDIQAGQWVMLTYDGTNMQMQSQTATAPGGSVTSVFARTGVVIAQAGDYSAGQITGLAPVATSGSYTDLSNKPIIPAAQASSDWNAASGVAQILNKPPLSIVATSGNYNDLSNKPSIPNIATTSSLLKGNGSGGVYAATAGTDYMTPSTPVQSSQLPPPAAARTGAVQSQD